MRSALRGGPNFIGMRCPPAADCHDETEDEYLGKTLEIVGCHAVEVNTRAAMLISRLGG